MKKYSGTLSDEEMASLKKVLRLKYFTAGLSILAAAVLIQIILMADDYSDKVTTIAYSFLGVIAFVIIIATIHFSKDLRRDINDSSKTIAEFIIENKGYFEDDEPDQGGSYVRYFILSEDYRFIVDKPLFDKAEKGDTLIKQYSSNELIFLKEDIRKKTGA